MKKNNDVIKLLAHIDVYLKEGINKIIVESIKTFDFKTFSIFEINSARVMEFSSSNNFKNVISNKRKGELEFLIL